MKISALLRALLLALLVATTPAVADDVSNGSWSPTDASNTAAPPNGWPAGMFANQVEPSARAMMGAISRWWERSNPKLTSGGSAGAYTLTTTNTSYPSAYTNGEIWCWKANFTSVGNDTLAVNSLGAKNIYIVGSSGAVQISAGTIASGELTCAAYSSALNSGAGGFQLLGGAYGAASGDLSGNFPNPTVTSTHLSAALPVAQGGTGLASGTSGGVPCFTASTTVASSAALGANALVVGGGAGVCPSSLGSTGTTTTVLHGNASGNPSYGAVNLGADVSGTLPVANGGTGQTTISGQLGALGLIQSPVVSAETNWNGAGVFISTSYNAGSHLATINRNNAVVGDYLFTVNTSSANGHSALAFGIDGSGRPLFGYSTSAISSLSGEVFLYDQAGTLRDPVRLTIFIP